uniref:uncharacterized protein LOC120332235 n=1 Tax=Styela clava TaxID=7725 RepID=UPI001939F175|nr:uncharacterized protein LOC120332235 [Styela clava]
MSFVKILFFISLVCGLYAELKLPAGSCVSKIVNGKLVQVGDCQKNDGSEIARLIKKNLDEKKKPKNKCDVTYDFKCYRIFVTDTKNITVRDAEAICNSKNSGKPANIYDEAHFQKLHAFQRTQIIAPWKKTSVWTGMKYKECSFNFPMENIVSAFQACGFLATRLASHHSQMLESV